MHTNLNAQVTKQATVTPKTLNYIIGTAVATVFMVASLVLGNYATSKNSTSGCGTCGAQSKPACACTHHK